MCVYIQLRSRMGIGIELWRVRSPQNLSKCWEHWMWSILLWTYCYTIKRSVEHRQAIPRLQTEITGDLLRASSARGTHSHCSTSSWPVHTVRTSGSEHFQGEHVCCGQDCNNVLTSRPWRGVGRMVAPVGPCEFGVQFVGWRGIILCHFCSASDILP